MLLAFGANIHPTKMYHKLDILYHLKNISMYIHHLFNLWRDLKHWYHSQSHSDK